MVTYSYLCVQNAMCSVFDIVSRHPSLQNLFLKKIYAMTVGKFILALSNEFKFPFISKLFSIEFCMKMIGN